MKTKYVKREANMANAITLAAMVSMRQKNMTSMAGRVNKALSG